MAEVNQERSVIYSFCSGYPERYFKKGRPLFYQGEIPQSVFFIKSGMIKFYNITSSGEEKIIGFESKNGLLPLEWLFKRSPVSLYYYDTVEDTQVFSVPRQDLMDYIGQNKQVAAELLDAYVGAYIGKTIHLHALEQSKARDKLLYILQFLVLRFGDKMDEKHTRITLRLTHQDIANLIGTTRETVSTEMSRITKLGVVKTKDLHYIVDTDKALRMLGESDFGELKL